MPKVYWAAEVLRGACKEETVTAKGVFLARALQREVLMFKEQEGGYMGVKSTTNPRCLE